MSENNDLRSFFKKEKKPIKQAIEFVEKGSVESPISTINREINGDTNFAITKLTENGKYVRGNLLFYSLNGVEVYTEANNIIFVDLVNNVLFIREYEKMIQDISPEDPEQKQYIILYTDISSNESEEERIPLRWEAYTGRMNTYEAIKVNAPIIDIDKSIVVVESVALKDCLSVREFVEYLKNANLTEKDDFDINDYSSKYI